MLYRENKTYIASESGHLRRDKKALALQARQRKQLRLIRKISRGFDYFILILSLLILCLAAYAFWDTHQVFRLASSEEYALYKPNSKDNLSFEQLRKLNDDVVGWIDVYGTKIDYPIVQGKDNSEYLNKTVLGEFSTAGSIFLDHRNNKDFSDYQNILYGHFMDQNKMFGDMELFKEEKFFNEHPYGSLYIADQKKVGIEFFAFIETLGTDQELLSPAKKFGDKRNLIEKIYKRSEFSRKLEFSKDERIVVLDTCDLSKTNGRYMLIGRLTEHVEKNIYKDDGNKRKTKNLFGSLYKLNWILILFLFWLILLLIYAYLKRKKKKEGDKHSESQKK